MYSVEERYHKIQDVEIFFRDELKKKMLKYLTQQMIINLALVKKNVVK